MNVFSSRSYFSPTILAILLHVLIIGAFVVNWSFTYESRPPQPMPHYVEAEVMDLKALSKGKSKSKPDAQRLAEQAKKVEEEKRKAEEAQRIQDEKRQAKEQAARELEEQKAAQKEAEQKAADEAAKVAEERKKAEAAQAAADEKAKAEEARKAAEDAKKAADAKAKAEADAQAKKQADAEAKAKAEAQKAADAKAKAEEAARQKKLDDARKKAAADAKQKAQEEKRKADDARQKAEEKQRQEALKKALQNDLNAATSDDSTSVNDAKGYINKMVSEAWVRPPSARNDMMVQLRITLTSSGKVVDVQVVNSSGNDAFDSSAVNAVRRVVQFDELQKLDPKVFDANFRNFILRFKPSDLRL